VVGALSEVQPNLPLAARRVWLRFW